MTKLKAKDEDVRALLDIVTQATIVLNAAHKYSARQRQYHATQLGYCFEYLNRNLNK